ncbi:hypothetical protein LD125_00148 [Mesoplasma sp. JKS002658]|uniref:SagB/ThcOx family dehydrogenase n=1 Tax=Mesoplasma whartonense TaxID=2878854 RepID=UPI002022B5A9|nr:MULTISPECIES: SagB/ThcOx family dehydrogenase [unclassified Mesoplasma]MCL8211541.1 hypothetical protein [Mesoplasma sp. JKS002664]MCL8212001.1 hypothetical protein [Mesoplasma sp. JKS002662]MCL8213621.1 hypothetical protein [Mesoplasma sp. JKS002660]MCL8213894.1 hypothetical protein [Mesoplasma sp. JKS002658]MCL8214860.1 hypothetical protein [Mesoplasma sp. JKS002663]
MKKEDEIKTSFSFNMGNQFVSKYPKQTLVKNNFAHENNLYYKNDDGLLMDLYFRNYKTNLNETDFSVSIASFFSEAAKMSLKYRFLEEATEKCIKLDKVNEELKSLDFCLKNRKSQRQFGKGFMSFKKISSIFSYLFSATYGEHLSYPSGGGLYPIKIFIYANKVEKIEKGFYQYQPYGHSLKLIQNEDLNIDNLIILPSADNNFSFLLFYVYDSNVNKYKYGDIAGIFGAIEVGSMLQNVDLLGAALNYGTCNLGSYTTEAVLKKLKLNNYFGIYLLNSSVIGENND